MKHNPNINAYKQMTIQSLCLVI